MIVVKLGGSLNRDPLLRDWLELLSRNGRGRVVIVPGGGRFADQVREHQALWQFDDLAAHNMAILAMMQSGTMYCSLAAGLHPATTRAEIAEVLRRGRVVVWRPSDWIRTRPNPMTNWHATSDSLAAWLASQVDATSLVLVKAADMNADPQPCKSARPGADEPRDRGEVLARYAESGLIDTEFCRLTAEATYSIELLGKTDLPRMLAVLRSPPDPDPPESQ